MNGNAVAFHETNSFFQIFIGKIGYFLEEKGWSGWKYIRKLNEC